MGCVFLSYRHESPARRKLVREFADLLVARGVEVILDQFFLDANPGGPDQGWDRWSAAQVKRATRVLIVASAAWYRCFEGEEEPGQGLGAACEARAIYSELYDARWVSAKHRIVVLEDPGAKPPSLLAWMARFEVATDPAAFDRLVDWIEEATRQDGAMADAAASATAWPPPVAGFVPDFADRKTEWRAVVELLSGPSRPRILLLEGEGDRGKSSFVRQCLSYAREATLPTAAVDFKGGHLTVQGILSEIDLSFGPLLPEFHACGAKDPYLLRRDLRALTRPLLVLFDTYEHAAGISEVTAWLNHQLLPEVERCPALAFIVAGRSSPSPDRAAWGEAACRLELGPITDVAAWEAWIGRRYPGLLQEIDLNTLVLLTEGNPGAIYRACANIAARLGGEAA